MRQVSVLFARSDSCYNELVADVWDIKRDARNYSGSNAVICHPPCRGWGRLRHLAKPRPDEKALALFALEQVRRCGGVLEHPLGSSLWHEANLPKPGFFDAWGGWTLLVDQGWFGHKAPKPTYLYICGVTSTQVPELPVKLQRAEGRTMRLTPAERELTPVEFARFLLAIAAQAVVPARCNTDLAAVSGSNNELAVTSSLARCNTHLVKKTAAEKRAAFRSFAGVR